MGATPVTKCVTILAVFNADCFTILPDFCRFIFPTLLTFTSAWQTVFPHSRAHGLKTSLPPQGQRPQRPIAFS